jgi:inorganic pyrophosphatase
VKLFIEKIRYEIQIYERSNDVKELGKTHISFCGSPYRQPQDPEKIILIVNPLSTHAFYYEFRSRDITYAEKLPSLVSLEGETIIMARIWVKQGSVGVRSSHFLVELLC